MEFGKPITVVSEKSNAVIWFRRDLRSIDHPALASAIQHARRAGGVVTAVFVLDNRLLRTSGPNRIAALFDALHSLRRAGIPLHIIEGDPSAEVLRVAKRCDADVFATEDFSPYGMSRDRAVAAALAQVGSTMRLVDSPYLVRPGTVRKLDGDPFRVFTPFKRVWLTHALGQRPDTTGELSTLTGARWSGETVSGAIPVAPSTATSGLPPMTEEAACDAFDVFMTERVTDYNESRNLPALDATSRLGAYLKYGVLHPRQMLGDIEPMVHAGNVGATTFLSELCWREFYADVLFHRPDSARHNYVTTLDIETDSGPTADQRFTAWCEGRTGYPFVDAGMRQLVAEGWMHNRVRMVVASFLVKDLHLPWQRGARWFMHHLIDGDIASNQHGWQWTAGTGTDAAPYFRVFNPVTQGKKFDPDGEYIRRWVPELASLPKAAVHEPWLHQAPRQLFDAGHPASYPDPIIDHAAERDEALVRFRVVRGG